VKLVDPAVNFVDWYIDGELVKKNGGENFYPHWYITTAGTYSIKAHIYDEVVEHSDSDNQNPHPLDLVRTKLDALQQEITWTIEWDASSDIEKMLSGNYSPLEIIQGARGGMEIKFRGKGDYHIKLISLNGVILYQHRVRGRGGDVQRFLTGEKLPRGMYVVNIVRLNTAKAQKWNIKWIKK